MRYDPRESINPRTFAVRHLLLEELKFRQRAAGPGVARNAWAALARTLDVAYEPATREFVVRGGTAEQRVPLDALRLYDGREDAEGDRQADWSRADPVLAMNRAVASRVVDALLPDAGHAAP